MNPRFAIVLLFVAVIAAGCDFTTPPRQETPTFQATPSLQSPTATATYTPSATPRTIAQVQLESPTVTDTPGTPTDTATPTPTPGPYEHVIQSGDTLYYIIQLYGYTTLDVVDDVVAMNGLSSADDLPGVGSVLLIPRQTATPTPEGMAATSDARATFGVNVEGLPNYPVDCHVVEEGETMVEIALEYNMTLEQLAQINPDISFSGCDFDVPSGGSNCNPFITVGQCVNVFLPTATPTLSPTPSGLETATSTPTFIAPIGSYPPEGALVPGGLLRLQWVSVGVLQADEYYWIQVIDVTADVGFDPLITRATSILLPEAMIPTDGQTHTFQWMISVARQNEQGAFRIVSGTATARTFQWQSR
jgi:LysM repeat protein